MLIRLHDQLQFNTIDPETLQSARTGLAQRLCLVVDDEGPVRAYICNLVRHAGFKALEAEDGSEALNLVRLLGSKVSIVISDIRMEPMDGIALARSLRNEFPTLPLVMVSGYADNYEQLSALGLNVVEKPFLPEVLLRAVSAAFENQ